MLGAIGAISLGILIQEMHNLLVKIFGRLSLKLTQQDLKRIKQEKGATMASLLLLFPIRPRTSVDKSKKVLIKEGYTQ